MMMRRTFLTVGLVILIGAGAFALAGAPTSRGTSSYCGTQRVPVGDTGGEGGGVMAQMVVADGGSGTKMPHREGSGSKASSDEGSGSKAALCKTCGKPKAACTGKAKGHVCSKACRVEQMGKLADAKAALATARVAVEAGQKVQALAALATAEKLVTEVHEKMVARTATKPAAGGVVNTRCPIMGSKIDPAKVPAALTREFKGRKVGFCCGGCPVAWDKLTDAEKQAKLDALSK